MDVKQGIADAEPPAMVLNGKSNTAIGQQDPKDDPACVCLKCEYVDRIKKVVLCKRLLRSHDSR